MRFVPKPIRLVLGSMAVLAVASACDSGSATHSTGASEPLNKAEYQQAILRIEGESGRAGHLFTELVTGQPQSECVSKARAFESELRRLVEEAAAIAPPEAVADAHRRFLVAARESVDEVGRAADRVERGEILCGRSMNLAIYDLPSTNRAEDALYDIEDEGYFVFGE